MNIAALQRGTFGLGDQLELYNCREVKSNIAAISLQPIVRPPGYRSASSLHSRPLIA
jgi:hypothetical protein